MSHVRKIIYRAGVNSCLTHGWTSTRYQALLIPSPLYPLPPTPLYTPTPFSRATDRSLHERIETEFGTATPENSHSLNSKSKVSVKESTLDTLANKDFPPTPSLGKSFWIRAWSSFFHSRDVSIPKEHGQFLLRNWLLVLGQIGWNDLIKPYQLRITVKSSFVPWKSPTSEDFRNGCVAIVFASIPTSKLIKWINTLPRKPSRSLEKSMHLRRFGVNFTIKETIIKHRDGKVRGWRDLGQYLHSTAIAMWYILVNPSK